MRIIRQEKTHCLRWNSSCPSPTPGLFFSSPYFQTPPPATQAETRGSLWPGPFTTFLPSHCFLLVLQLSPEPELWCPRCTGPQLAPALPFRLTARGVLQTGCCPFAFVFLWIIRSFPFICPETSRLWPLLPCSSGVSPFLSSTTSVPVTTEPILPGT